jgi:hypothetical protein
VEEDNGRNPYEITSGFTGPIVPVRLKHLKPRCYRTETEADKRLIYFFETRNPFWAEDVKAILAKPKEVWRILIFPLGQQSIISLNIFLLRIQPATAISQLDMLLLQVSNRKGRPPITYKFLQTLQHEIKELEFRNPTEVREELRKELEEEVREELREELEEEVREELREELEKEIREELREELEEEEK